jgi:hypothetical protein
MYSAFWPGRNTVRSRTLAARMSASSTNCRSVQSETPDSELHFLHSNFGAGTSRWHRSYVDKLSLQEKPGEIFMGEKQRRMVEI